MCVPEGQRRQRYGARIGDVEAHPSRLYPRSPVVSPNSSIESKRQNTRLYLSVSYQLLIAHRRQGQYLEESRKVIFIGHVTHVMDLSSLELKLGTRVLNGQLTTQLT
jgi:hypothetical protein